MPLFANHNLIGHIVRSRKIDIAIDPQHETAILTLIEIQTRLVLETAAKFMRADRRDTISVADVQLAIKELNHAELIMSPYDCGPGQAAKEDKRYASADQLMQEQLQLMGERQIERPRLDGRWIFLKGKVPNINQNIHIRREMQVAESEKQEREEKRKLWKIIKDEPYSYLNQEQSDYFISICKVISGDFAPRGNMVIDGNLNSLLPFLLKFLGSRPLNETGISFLLQMLENKQIWKAVEFGAVKSLNLLLAYKGPQAFEVGVKIAQIVESLCDKYPVLRDIYINIQDESYSTILKKIPFELYLGVPFQITEELLFLCKQDAEKNDQIAILLLKALLAHSSQLRVFKKFLAQKMSTFVFWHPSSELRDDPYLKMY